MSLPTRCAMPDLSGLDAPVMGNYLLNLTLRGAGARDRTASTYLVSYIRLADKALTEYELARLMLTQCVASNNNRILLLIQCVANLETCINNIKRALNFVDRMKRHQKGPDVPRLVRRFLNSSGRSISDIRNAVEHMDEMIERGEVSEGEPIALLVGPEGDRIEIANQQITFVDLADLIRNLHSFAVELSDYREPT